MKGQIEVNIFIKTAIGDCVSIVSTAIMWSNCTRTKFTISDKGAEIYTRACYTWRLRQMGHIMFSHLHGLFSKAIHRI